MDKFNNDEEKLSKEYFLKNIKDIDSIILYRPYMFLETESSINYFFNKFNLEEIVNKINDDYSNVDLLFE